MTNHLRPHILPLGDPVPLLRRPNLPFPVPLRKTWPRTQQLSCDRLGMLVAARSQWDVVCCRSCLLLAHLGR